MFLVVSDSSDLQVQRYVDNYTGAKKKEYVNKEKDKKNTFCNK